MFNTISSSMQNTIVIKRSDFITTLIPIDDGEDAELKINDIRKKYSDATHNCYAYIADEIGNVARFSDAGEPQGTAGLPMLEVLKKRRVFKVLAVVTRYFGGVKLGASGLCGAYSQSVAKALDIANVMQCVFCSRYSTHVEYSSYKLIVDKLQNKNAKILNIEYSDNVKIEWAIAQEDAHSVENALVDMMHGAIEIVNRGNEYVLFDNGV